MNDFMRNALLAIDSVDVTNLDIYSNGIEFIGAYAAIAYIVILVIMIALAVVAVLLAPDPPVPKSASLEDFNFPTADQERSVPVLFGTRLVKGPNVTWFGDLRADPKYTEGGGKK